MWQVHEQCHRRLQLGMLRELDDGGGEPFLVVPAPRDLALRRAVLAERRAGATLGYAQFPANMLDAGAATRGAQ